jgi:hypothetical protein
MNIAIDEFKEFIDTGIIDIRDEKWIEIGSPDMVCNLGV